MLRSSVKHIKQGYNDNIKPFVDFSFGKIGHCWKQYSVDLELFSVAVAEDWLHGKLH